MREWSADSIRFLADASERLRFNDALAARAAKHIPPGARVLDAGCGLGYLSLSLLPYCGRVTAADSSAAALAVLRENAAGADAARLDIRQGDVFAIPESERFDVVVCCFFASVEETLRLAQKHGARTAVLFKKDWQTRRFSLREEPVRNITLAEAAAELGALGVPYVSETFPLDMGQPFRSADDAARFFTLYSGGGPVSPEEAAGRLEAADSPDFPLYLPAVRRVGMIAATVEDIQHQINGGNI